MSRWFCGALVWPFRACPSPGGSDLYQRVLGSSPRPDFIKIGYKKRGKKRREKKLILRHVPWWRKTSEEEEGKRKRKLEEERNAKYPRTRKRRTIECVETSHSFMGMADNPTRNKYKYVSSTLSLTLQYLNWVCLLAVRDRRLSTLAPVAGCPALSAEAAREPAVHASRCI